MRYEDREDLARLLRAARDWAPTRITRTGMGTKQRLMQAVTACADVDLEDLEAPSPPAFVALHGEALQDFLDQMGDLANSRSMTHALELMVDGEGLKVRVNGGPTWSPGLGEPRGSQ